MTDEIPEIIDHSRVDAYAATRRRAMVLHSVWRPMLAGAAGAALVVAAVYVTLPKFSVRDVVVDHVVQHDVPFDNHVPREVPFDNYVPRPAARPPVAANPPAPRSDAPKTPAEKKFVDKPEYKTATYRGRIVKSRDGHVLSFEDGKDFQPAHWDDATGKVVYDPDQVIRSDEFVGDLGVCVPEKGHGEMWDCTAMHDGVEVYVSGDNSGRPVEQIGSIPTLDGMISVDIDVAGYPIKAEVDTGCSWPMALPSVLADELLKRGLATRAGSSKSRLADGSEHEFSIIMIRSVTVDGRVLRDVEASVAPSPTATVLLGLAALKRLGPFKVEEGRIVFTGEQPT